MPLWQGWLGKRVQLLLLQCCWTGRLLLLLLLLLPHSWLCCWRTLLVLGRMRSVLPAAVSTGLPARPTCQIKAVGCIIKAAATQRLMLLLPAAAATPSHRRGCVACLLLQRHCLLLLLLLRLRLPRLEQHRAALIHLGSWCCRPGGLLRLLCLLLLLRLLLLPLRLALPPQRLLPGFLASPLLLLAPPAEPRAACLHCGVLLLLLHPRVQGSRRRALGSLHLTSIWQTVQGWGGGALPLAGFELLLPPAQWNIFLLLLLLQPGCCCRCPCLLLQAGWRVLWLLCRQLHLLWWRLGWPLLHRLQRLHRLLLLWTGTTCLPLPLGQRHILLCHLSGPVLSCLLCLLCNDAPASRLPKPLLLWASI